MEVKNKILVVIAITIITMILEIAYGFITNSMALLADGFHMGTHALALAVTYIAYFLCQKFLNCTKFLSGTDKIKELAGYTSSLFLGISGFCIIIESIQRFFNPLNIDFFQAMLVVVIGLVVNLVSVLIMDCDHNGAHTHHEHDNNFKSAYFHILADLLTSVFALLALLGGKYFGLVVLDPLIGLLGGIIIIKWAFDLIRATTIKLLDIDI